MYAIRSYYVIDAEVLELYRFQATIAAGVDPRKWCQVHIDIEAQTVVAAAVAHPQAQRRHLGTIDVDTRRTGLAFGPQAIVGQAVDDGLSYNFV